MHAEAHSYAPEPVYEPEEGDLITEDHARFYQDGKLVVEVRPRAHDRVLWTALDAHMKKTNFYPNVWFVSDHGNAQLMSRPQRTRTFRR